MALQKVVNVTPALGVPGSAAAFMGEVSTVHQYLSDGTAKAGSFALPSAADVNTTGTAVGGGVVGLANSSATAAIGLVVRTITGTLAPNVDASLVYEKGAAVTVAIRGDFYIAATESATVGEKVIVTVATGAISFASSASSGEIDTGWTVTTPASASGDIIVISNHG